MSETHTVRYLTCAETAKLLRAALKAAHPGVKFSVRSSVYSMGASIDVSWTDGPTADQVDETAKRYAGATFDGMQDLKEYHTDLVAFGDGLPELVYHGADFVFTHRANSTARLAYLADQAEAEHGSRRGQLHTAEQCRRCGDWMPAGFDCYVTTGRWGTEFVCCATCAAIVTANTTPA